MANKYTASSIPEGLADLYSNGLTQTEIAGHFGVTQKQVWCWMKRAGLKARVAAKREQRGSANASWRGNAACYAAFHKRVEAARGKPKRCEVCGTEENNKHYDWANLTGNYQDVTDYKRMCRSCHWKFDNKIQNITRMRKRGAECQKTS